jgi:hypothetical protein
MENTLEAARTLLLANEVSKMQSQLNDMTLLMKQIGANKATEQNK